MRLMSRSIAILIGGVVFLLGIPALAGATTTLDQFKLDSYAKWYLPFTPTVTSKAVLGKGLYVAVVKGTMSFWSSKNYVHPRPTRFHPWTIVCGTPEAAPEFSSAGGTGGVGLDAEFVFSRPWSPRECARWPLPRRSRNFQMNTGRGWQHPTALNLTWPDPAPTAGHVYEYPIRETSWPQRVQFRLLDWDTRDNYGSLMITLRAAGPSDCTGTRYLGFGLKSEAECVAMIKP